MLAISFSLNNKETIQNPRSLQAHRHSGISRLWFYSSPQLGVYTSFFLRTLPSQYIYEALAAIIDAGFVDLNSALAKKLLHKSLEVFSKCKIVWVCRNKLSEFEGFTE